MIDLIGGTLFISVISTVLIGMVLLLRRVFKDAYVYWRMILWVMIIIRMLLPITGASELSVFNLLDLNKSIVITPNADFGLILDSDQGSEQVDASGEVLDTVYANDEGLSPNNPIVLQTESLTVAQIAQIIWISGMVICAVIYYVNYRKYKQNAETSACDNARILTILTEECRKFKVSCEAYWTYDDNIIALSGLFRPRILVSPALNRCTDEQVRFAIRHELAHYVRHDLLLLNAYEIVKILHWFNPVVWLMERVLREDIEIATDATAITRIPIYERKAYGITLITMSSMFPKGSGQAYAAQLLNQNSLRSRISSIANFKSKKTLGNVAIIAITSLLILSFSTLPTLASETTSNPIHIAEDIIEGFSGYDQLMDTIVNARRLESLSISAESIINSCEYNVKYYSGDSGIAYYSCPTSAFRKDLRSSGMFLSLVRINNCSASELLSERECNADEVLTKPIRISPDVLDMSCIEGNVTRLYMRYVVYKDAVKYTDKSGYRYTADIVACEYLMSRKDGAIVSVSFAKAIVDKSDSYSAAPWRSGHSSADKDNRITYIFSERQMLNYLVEMDLNSFIAVNGVGFGGGDVSAASSAHSAS